MSDRVRQASRGLLVVGANLLLALVLLALLELVLRAAGMRPLYDPPRETEGRKPGLERICRALGKGDEVTLRDDFYTDDRGVFRASPRLRERAGRNGLRVNSSGFRGNEFEPAHGARPTVLFLGDSFTWGASAVPITRSFPDLVAESGYHVYNGGIPGTDPQQYALLAELYVPQLEPKATVVCLYLGNDLKGYAVPLLPGRNLHFVTDLGYLRGYDEKGHYFANGEAALLYTKKQHCGCVDHLGDAILYHTVVGKAFRRGFYARSHIRSDPERRWVVDALERIRAVCDAHGSRLLLLLIPNKHPQKNERLLKLVRSFEGFSFHYPEGFGPSSYAPDPDNHFNNEGHRAFAAFVRERLVAEGLPGSR